MKEINDEEKKCEKIYFIAHIILMPIRIVMIIVAVLIVIVLTYLLLDIYNSANNTHGGGYGSPMMGSQEKEMYNSTVTKYVGEYRKGSEVKQMINDIIQNNEQNVNESGRFISVHNGKKVKKNTDSKHEVKEYKNGEILDDLCHAANIHENPSKGENNKGNIDAAAEEMRNFSKKISSEKHYCIEVEKEDEMVYAVYISQAN